MNDWSVFDSAWAAVVRFVMAIAWAVAGPAQHQRLQLDVMPSAQSATDVVGIVEDLDRRLWIASFDRLLCDEGFGFVQVEIAPRADGTKPLRIRDLAVATDGSLLVASSSGLWRVERGSRCARLVPSTDRWHVWGVQARRLDDVWLGVGHQVRRLDLVHGLVEQTTSGPGRAQVLQRGSGGIWSWNDEGLWRLDDRGGDWHRPASGVRPDRFLAVWNDDAVVDFHGELVLVSPAGGTRALCSSQPITGPLVLACVVPQGLFLLCAHSGQAFLLPPGGRLEPLDPSDGRCLGAAVRPLVLAADRQGLVWIGGAQSGSSSVVRARVLSGLSSSPLPELRDGESVQAIHAADSSVWLGTNFGRLMRHEAGRTEVLDVPWRPGVMPAGILPQEVRFLTVATDGQLVAGLSRQVWRFDGVWHLLMDREDEIVGVAFGDGGRLWVGSSDRVLWASWSEVREGRGDWASSPRIPAGVSMLEPGAEGDVWVVEGERRILRLDSALQWSADAVATDAHVASLLAAGDGGLWVLTSRSLGHLDPGADAVRAVFANPNPSDRFLGLARVTNGDLMLLKQRDVHRLDASGRQSASRLELLPPGSWTWRRPLCVAPDGACWTASLHGFERIEADSCPHVPWTGGVSGFRLVCGGRNENFDCVASLPDLTCEAATAPNLVPRIVDRALARVPKSEVTLQPIGDGSACPIDGSTMPAPGVYTIVCRVDVPGTGLVEQQLGRLTLRPASESLPVVLGGLALVGLGLLVPWRIRRTRNRRVLRFDRISAAGGRSQHELVDLAAAAVTVAEALRDEMGSPHASVILQNGSESPEVIAEIGRVCDHALDLARTCREEGLHVGERYHYACGGRRSHLLVIVEEEAAIQLSILLKSVRVMSAQHLGRLQTLLQPVLSGVQKHIWLQRLEADYAEKSSAFEAEAHDLRSPLTALRFGVAEMLDLSTRRSDEEMCRVASEVDALLARVVGGLDGILRRSPSVPGIELREADPTALARSVVQQMRPLATRKGVHLDDLESGRISSVRIDELWLRRVLENLLGNAIKFSPPGKTVRCFVLETDRHCRLVVEDEGPGFSVAETDAVFLPGVIGTAKATAGEAKTGIGLWIARQAVAAMGGEVRIGNRDAGGGRVEIVLPRTAQA